MSLTKLSLAGKNLIIPGQGEFGDIPAGGMENCYLFFTVQALPGTERRERVRVEKVASLTDMIAGVRIG
jgi:hypothetical protein